jgi:hypothetical protein
MPPKNRSPTGEAEAAWRFDRCCPAPSYALSVTTVSSWSASAAHPAPGRRGEPSGTPGPLHGGSTSGKPSRPPPAFVGRLLGGVTAHADPDRPQAVDLPHRLDDVDG